MAGKTLMRVVLALIVGGAAWALVEAAGAAAQEKKKDKQEGKKGKVVGTLTAKGPNFIEVKADGEEKARKYVPMWVGGMPDKGGGFDKAILKTFASLKVGSRIQVEWLFEERLRALKIELLKAPEKK